MPSGLYPAVGYPHTHGLAPGQKLDVTDIGPRALAYQLAIGNGVVAAFDLTKEIEGVQIDQVQALFIDNSGNSSPVTVQSSEIQGMKIVLGANKQGVFPFFGKTLSTVTVSTPNVSSVTVGLLFLNTPQPYASWPSL